MQPQPDPGSSLSGVIASVVIAAHNEEAVIGRTLDALLAQELPGRVQVIVVANGCTDDTAAVAAGRGVEVIDRPEPGKPGALNAGDSLAVGFPRVYLDADILVPPTGLAAVLSRFAAEPAPLAVVPRRRLVTEGRPWPVRAYFTINERLPVFRGGLFGRGMIAVSEAGRGRFGEFPALIADDLFLDSQFTPSEKAEATQVAVEVATPFTTRDLLRRLVRVRRGNSQLRRAGAGGALGVPIRSSDRWAWLRDVVLPEPRLAPSALAYVAITLAAELMSRRSSRGQDSWGRDESTRRAGGQETGT